MGGNKVEGGWGPCGEAVAAVAGRAERAGVCSWCDKLF